MIELLDPLRSPDLLARIFDAYPSPTLLVDGDVRVLHANRAARDELDLAAGGEPLRMRSGELLQCLNTSAHPEGCGHADACRRCVVRGSVSRALSSGAVRRARAFMQLSRGGRVDEVHYLVSAAPIAHEGRALAILTLEDVSEIVHLRSLLPICAGCRKIRDGDNYWRTVEEYFKQSLDIDFSHGFCEACVERLYPEVVIARGRPPGGT